MTRKKFSGHKKEGLDNAGSGQHDTPPVKEIVFKHGNEFEKTNFSGDLEREDQQAKKSDY